MGLPGPSSPFLKMREHTVPSREEASRVDPSRDQLRSVVLPVGAGWGFKSRPGLDRWLEESVLLNELNSATRVGGYGPTLCM